MRNALVALGGGSSPVINSSLCGVVERCMEYPGRIGKIYAAWHGVEGIMQEEFIDMRAQPGREVALLKHTPATGGVGTCRYKLEEWQHDDFARIIEVMRANDIGYFFYIGGNDSMDTADKIAALARASSLDLVVAGVPKTIDNDVGDDKFTIIDHTPGYGSAARYWACTIQDTLEENRGMSVTEPVMVLQAMGRKSGYITAAARLADPERLQPLQMYFPEPGLGPEELPENVNAELTRSGRCVVVVNEGFNAGSLGEARDGFGHIEYGASRSTVAQNVTNYLNEHGLKARGQATGQVPGIIQRSTGAYRSAVDVEEAYAVGAHAVDVAMNDGSGYMATILRKPGAGYAVYYDKVPLRVVANSERFLPADWIAANKVDVTDDFVRYALPLIGNGWPYGEIENGLQRYARIEAEFVPQLCPPYTPQKFTKR